MSGTENAGTEQITCRVCGRSFEKEIAAAWHEEQTGHDEWSDQEDDDPRTDGGTEQSGTERLERFCATCGSTDLSTASVREGTYECGGCGHVIGRTHVRRVGGDRGV